MVKYNLTDSQKNLLKELVALIQSGSVATAVETDFNAPDTSFIKYLTPLTGLENNSERNPIVVTVQFQNEEKYTSKI